MPYISGNCSFDDNRFALQRDGCDVHLRPKSVDLLLILVSSPGCMITKEELLEKVWPDVTVGVDSLTQCIHEIRSAIGPENSDLLRTIRGRGYMLDVKVERAGESTDLPPTPINRRRPVFILAATAIVAIGSLAVAVGWLAISNQSPKSANLITEFPLLLIGSTILGENFAYPEGEPEVASAIITLHPGFRGDWHTHQSPTLVHILEGEIEVEYEDGRIIGLTGERAFIEDVGVPHIARNVGTRPARFMVVNIGAKGKAIREFIDAPADAVVRSMGSGQ